MAELIREVGRDEPGGDRVNHALQVIVWNGVDGWTKRHLTRGGLRTLCGERIVRVYDMVTSDYGTLFGEGENDCDRCRVFRLREVLREAR